MIHHGQKSRTEHIPRVRGCEYTNILLDDITAGVCWYLSRISALFFGFLKSHFKLLLALESFKSLGLKSIKILAIGHFTMWCSPIISFPAATRVTNLSWSSCKKKQVKSKCICNCDLIHHLDKQIKVSISCIKKSSICHY